MEQINDSSLENAIKDEAGKVLLETSRKEAVELSRLEKTFEAEIEAFKKRTEAETGAVILREISRAESRAALEDKKFRLKSFEAFVRGILGQTLEELKKTPGYRQFLKNAAAFALCQIRTNAEIRLGRADLSLEVEIREFLKASGMKKEISFVEDGTLAPGGCVIADKTGGRIFDSSIERICFSKSAQIRREIKSLMEKENETGRERP